MKAIKLFRQFAGMMALWGVNLVVNQGQVLAANVWIDTNGTGASSGVVNNGAYSWESAFWSADVNGAAATSNWVDGDTANFAAGTDVTSATQATTTIYAITANANHVVNGFVVKATNGGQVYLNGTGILSLNGTQAFTVNTPAFQNLKILNTLADGASPGQVNWTGSTGSLYLYGNNTYSGGTLLNSTSGVNFNNANSFGTGPITWGGASQLLAIPTGSFAPTSMPNGDATAAFTVANNMVTRSASTLIMVNPTTAPTTWSGAWTLATGVSTLDVRSTTTMTISGVISGTDGTSALTKGGTNGTGVLILSNAANSYAGVTTAGNGILSVANIGNAGANSSLGTNGSINLGATTLTGNLRYTGTGETSDKVVNLNGTTGGGTLEQAGASGVLKFTSNLTAAASAKTLTLQGSAVGTGEFAGVISNGSGTVALTKAGTGRWTLSGANTYSGVTTISAGVLQFANTNAMSNAASPITNSVTVSSGGTLAVNAGGGGTEWTNATSGVGTIGGLIAGAGGKTGTANQVAWVAGSSLGIDTTNGSVSYSDPIGTFRTSAGTTDAVGLNKLGTGVLTLSGNNIYTGTTLITAGAIAAGSNSALGTTAGSTTVSSGAALQISGTGLNLGDALLISGTGVATDGALRNLANNNTYSGAITLAAASRINSDAGLLTISNTVRSSNATARALTVGGAGDTTITGMIGAVSGTPINSLTKDGIGTLTISGANAYTTVTTITAGTLKLGASGVIPDGSAVTVTGTLDMNSFNETIGSLAGAGGILSPGDLTTGGDNTSTTYSGAMSGSGSFTKAGTGTQTLTGTNNYSGTTTVSAGSLLVNGSLTGSGAVAVNGGTLGGNGSISGAVTVASGARIAAGIGGGNATLNVGGLAMGGGAILKSTLGAVGSPIGSSDFVNVTTAGALDLSNSGVVVEIGTANGFSNGTYRIAKYNGSFVGSTTNLALLGSQAAGFDSVSFSDNPTDQSIEVSVVVAERNWVEDSGTGDWSLGTNWGSVQSEPNAPGTIANFIATSPNNPAHVVTIDNADKTVGVVNLNNSTGYTIAASGTNKLILDTWGADGVVNVTAGSHTISAPVQMNKNTSVTVSGSNSLLMSGVVSGTGVTLIKEGSGTLTLSGTNTYTNGVGGRNVFNGGVVSISADLNLGAAPGAATNDMLVFNGGTLQLTSSFALSTNRRTTVSAGGGAIDVSSGSAVTYAGLISGTGSLTKTGAGTLTLTGSNTGFLGTFVLNQGTIGVGNNNAFGSAAGAAVTINGGVLSNTATAGRTINALVPVSLSGDFTVDDSQFNSSTPGQILVNGVSTIKNSNRTITVNGTANLGLGGVVGQDVSGRSLTKSGGGILALNNAANTYSGSTTILAGQVNVDADGSLGDGTGDLNLSGGKLNASASRTVTTPNPVHLNASSAITTTSAAATGQFNFGSNTVTGVGGAVLTLRNDGGDASTDQFQVRFFGSGFNFANNIDMPTGTASSTTELSSFNVSSTSQTFSGVISGTGDFKRSSSDGGVSGTTLFTAQNIFTGGTQLNDGTIEFGVDSVSVSGSVVSGPVGTGTITLNGGTAVNVGRLAASGGARIVDNAIAFGTGTTLGITGSNNLTLGGAVNLGTAVRTLNVDNTGDSTISGVISSGAGGGLIKSGAGKLILTNANTYSGSTTVSGGTLLVNGSIASAVSVNSGATLGGTSGTITGAVSNSGTIAPGASIGTLNVTGNVTMNDNSTLAIELGTGISSDLLNITGDLDLTSTFDTLALSGSLTGGDWTIVNYSGNLVGGFHFDTVTGLPAGYQVSYDSPNQIKVISAGYPGDYSDNSVVDAADYVLWRKYDGTATTLPHDSTSGTDATDYTVWRANFGQPSGSGSSFNTNTAVPEPATLGLLILAATGWCVLRRRAA